MHLGWRFLIFKAPGIYKYKEPKTQGKVERVTTSGAQTRFEEEGASEQVKRGGESDFRRETPRKFAWRENSQAASGHLHIEEEEAEKRVGGRIVSALLYYDHIIKGANGLTHTHTHKQERMRRPAAKKVDGTMCVLGRLKEEKKPG